MHTPTSRLSSQPFTIHLPGNDYTINIDELENQLDKKLLRKTTWFSPHLKFKSFRGKQLTLINSFKEQHYLLRIVIEPGNLAVSCSCNQSVQTLCLHSYRALRDIAHLKGCRYFKQFAPGGLAITALANKKAFVFNGPHMLNPDIRPVAPHKHVYGLNSSLPSVKNLLQPPAEPPKQDMLVSYLILSFARRSVPPILMPCLGVPAKNSNSIKRFLSFSETILPGNARYFNDTQQLLNRLCFAMIKEAEQVQLHEYVSPPLWQWHSYEQLFQLWQQSWPLLCTQAMIYNSHIYFLKDLKGKPMARKTIPVTVSPDKVLPQFFLKTLPGHRQLTMKIVHQNKQLQSEPGYLPFFVNCPQTNTVYLLPSLAVSKLVSEMKDLDPFVSIFKQQYKTFQSNVLTPLEKQDLLKPAAPKKKTKKTSKKK